MIYLLAGEEYEGIVQKASNDSVFFKVDKETKKFKLSDVVRIEFEELHSAYKAKDLKDRLIDSLLKYGAGSKEYPNSHSVTLYDKVSYRINPDSSWSRTERMIEKVLQPGGRWVASKNFRYLKDSQKLEVKTARTIQPDGKIDWLKQNAKKDESVYARFPMYDNLNQIRFALPEAKLGGLVDVQYEYKFPKISITEQFLIEEIFRSLEPIEYKEVELVYPAGMELEIKCDSGITSRITTNKGEKVYRFIIRKAKEIKEEYMLPPIQDIAPRIIISLKSDWNTLGSGYYKLLSERMTCGAGIKNKITELKTAEKIYNFVAREIKTVSISELSQYSWIPNPPDSIFNNKGGSLPDKTFLLYAMLKEAGLKDVELIMTSQLNNGKGDKDIHTISQFPSFVVKCGNEWLYPASEKIAFGELPMYYQNRLGLRIGDIIETVNIPSFEPEKEAVLRNLFINLEPNGTMAVKEVVKISGNVAQSFREQKVLKAEELKQYFEKQVNSICQGAELISFKTSNLEDLFEPVWYELEYKLPEYALSAGDNLMFKLPGVNYTAVEVGQPTRDNPMEFGMRNMRVVEMEIEYPCKYSAYYIPKDYSYNSNVANYEAKFTETKASGLCKLFGGKNRIKFSDKSSLTTSFISQPQYSEYKGYIETRAKLAQEWVALRKK